MAETLLGNLLGQTSNSTLSGLLGGPSIFQTQPSRGQRRSALLSQAISNQGSNPYARLGAAFGGLIGMGGRAAGEGLGILQEPEQVRRSRLITEAQQAAAESGIDPVAEPERFLEVIDPIVESDPLLKSGIRSQIIRLQRELAPDPRNAIELEQARLELAQTKQEADKNAQALEMNRVLPELNQSFSSISELDISERLPALVELEQRASSVTTSQGKEFLDKVRKRRQKIQDELESEASDNNVTNGSVILTDQGSKYIGEKNGTLVEVTAEGVVPFTGQFVENPESYKTFYSPDGETAVQARVENGRLTTLAGEDITGQGYATSRGGSLVSTDRSEEIATEEALKNSQQIQERNVALAGVVRSANDILTLAEQSKGTSLGVVGDIVRIGQGLTAQAQTAANAMGFSLDPDNYDFGAFPDASSKEAAQRTETLALAYNILRAREPQARQFSNADIQNTLDTIGGNSGSYQQLYSQLSQVVRSSLSSANESYQSQVRTFEGANVQAPPSPTDYLRNLESPIAGVSYDIPLFTQYGDLQERRAAEDWVNEAVQEGSLPENVSLGNFNSNTDSFEILDEKGNLFQELQVERGQ